MREEPSFSDQGIGGITFSPEEIAWAERHVKRLEKDGGKHWRWYRWIMLIFSLGLIAGSTYALVVYIPQAMETMGNFSYIGDEFVPDRLELLVDGKMTALRFQIFFSLQCLFFVIMGLMELGKCIKYWDRHITSPLLAKVIRTQMLETKTERAIDSR